MKQETTTPSHRAPELLCSEELVPEVQDFLNCSLSDGHFSINGSNKRFEQNRINISLEASKDHHDNVSLAHYISVPQSPIMLNSSKGHEFHGQSKSMMQFIFLKQFISRINLKRKLISLFHKNHYDLIKDLASDWNEKHFRENSLKLIPFINLTSGPTTQVKQKEDSSLWKSAKTLYKRTTKQLKLVSDRIDLFVGSLPTIPSEAKWKIWWDCLIMVARLYYLFIIPIELAWKDVVFIYGELKFASITLLVLLIFDFLMSLNNEFYEFGQIVTQRSKIVKNVLMKSYGLEAASILILFIYMVLSASEPLGINISEDWYHICLLIFYCQCRNIPKLITQVEEVLNLSKPVSSMLELFKLIVVLFFVLHCYSCLWFFVGEYTYEANFKGSWLVAQGIQAESWSIQYLYSFYFSTVTMFTIGYGDVIPINYLERLMAILYMMICSIQLSYSVNTVGAIIDKISAYSSQKMRKMHTINTYMQSKQISEDVKSQVREYLNYYWQEAERASQHEEEQEIVSQLSEQLREVLMIEADQRMLNSCPLFKNHFSDPLKRRLVKKIKQVVLQPAKIIDFASLCQNQGGSAIYLCFVEQGDISIFIQNDNNDVENPSVSVVKDVKQGSILGLESFITGVPTIERYKCVGFTKLLLLSRDDFLKILSDFPEDYERYRTIHDQMVYTDQNTLDIRCFSCGSDKHQVVTCPLLHFIPDKELIIKRHQYSEPHERMPFERNEIRQKNLFAARVDMEMIKQYATSFINENWQWAEFYDEPPDDMENPLQMKSTQVADKQSGMLQTVQAAQSGGYVQNQDSAQQINIQIQPTDQEIYQHAAALNNQVQSFNQLHVRNHNQRRLSGSRQDLDRLENQMQREEKQQDKLEKQQEQQDKHQEKQEKPEKPEEQTKQRNSAVLDQQTGQAKLQPMKNTGRKLRPSCTVEITEMKKRAVLKKVRRVVNLIGNINSMKKKRAPRVLPNKVANVFLEALQNQSAMKHWQAKVNVRLYQVSAGKRRILKEADVQDLQLLNIKLKMLIQKNLEFTKQETSKTYESCKQFKNYMEMHNLDRILERQEFYKRQNEKNSGIVALRQKLMRYMIYPEIYIVKYKYPQNKEKKEALSSETDHKESNQHYQYQENKTEKSESVKHKSKIDRKAFRNIKNGQVKPETTSHSLAQL